MIGEYDPEEIKSCVVTLYAGAAASCGWILRERRMFASAQGATTGWRATGWKRTSVNRSCVPAPPTSLHSTGTEIDGTRAGTAKIPASREGASVKWVVALPGI